MKPCHLRVVGRHHHKDATRFSQRSRVVVHITGVERSAFSARSAAQGKEYTEKLWNRTSSRLEYGTPSDPLRGLSLGEPVCILPTPCQSKT